jgi:hypothetical protein
MECPICNNYCNLPNEKKLNGRFAILDSTDRLVCNECYDILDWAVTTCNSTPIIKSKKSKPKVESKKKDNQSSSLMMINCPKCHNIFADKICKCGYKNPLFRF